MILQHMSSQSVLNLPGTPVFKIGMTVSAPALTSPVIPSSLPLNHPLAQIKESWDDKEMREAYMEATVEQDIAWQIKLNRIKRKLSQRDLAKKINSTQSGIHRFEDPLYGRHSIPTLVRIANAFDCALSVRLIPFSKLAEITRDTTEQAFLVKSYDDEIKELT